MIDGEAALVMPPACRSRIGAMRQRWLSRGRVVEPPVQHAALRATLSAVGAPAAQGGLAALRLWGQTGARPTRWTAAADPVHYETRLRDLVLRSFLPGEVRDDELRALFADLQASLGGDGQLIFCSEGGNGYLQAEAAIPVADVPVAIAAGQTPDRFAPAGQAAAAYRTLQAEIEMVLHASPANQERVARALPAINALWLWGGGLAPQAQDCVLPDLVSDDPLFRGHWLRCGGTVAPWDSDVAAWPGGSVVAVAPPAMNDTPGGIAACLDQLHAQLKHGDRQKLTVVFPEGPTVEIFRRDLLKVWRGVSSLFRESGEHG